MMVDLVENKEREIARAADPYYDIRIQENYVDDNICCDICLEFDHDLDNKIVLCDLCNVAVHQSCYGSELLDSVPAGDWYCDRCKSMK